MTLEELISAVERLQIVYDTMTDDQDEAKRYVRWAIKHLSEKIWSASL